MKVLVVDDNEKNIYLVRFLLEKQGHAVDEAYNGKEAVQAVNNTRYDLVLMDIQMPVMDGLEATRLIKANESAPPVVALTAKAMQSDREKVFACGCDGYITKPINAASFVKEIESFVISGRDTQDERS